MRLISLISKQIKKKSEKAKIIARILTSWTRITVSNLLNVSFHIVIYFLFEEQTNIMLHSYNSSGIFVCAVSRRPLRLKGLTATDKILWNSLAFFLPAVPLWPRPTQTKNLYETGYLRERDFHSTINNITFIKLIICLFPLHSLLENVTQPIKSLLTSVRL